MNRSQARAFKRFFNEAGGYQSVAKRSIHSKHSRIKEVIMGITTSTDQNALVLFVDNISDILILFKAASPMILNFFDNCFEKTSFCVNVNNVEWLPIL